MTRFAIVDLANLFYRCQHVTHGDAFTKAGMALHIVFRSLRKLHREMKVDHMVFCTEGKSWRYQVFPQYKAKRKLERLDKSPREKEEDEIFFQTLDNFINFLAEKTRCTVLHSAGVEGDDFVARWIQLHPNDEHILLSGDSDFIQLLAPNVTIMDGVQERLISMDGVKDFKGNDLVFSIDPSKGKLKVSGTLAEVKKKHDKEQKEKKAKHEAQEKARSKAHDAAEAQKAKDNPGYKKKLYIPTPFTAEEFIFQPEPDWWKKALFIKCIRGDAGDGIFSAYPGVRYEGSKNKVGIREAWEDRLGGGFHWNNFMLQRWDKLVGQDKDGNAIKENVRVLDEYRFNELLIDLTQQPDDVKALMDEVIVQAVQKEPVGNIGIHFLRFCNDHQLNNLGKEASDHAAYLNAPYSR